MDDAAALPFFFYGTLMRGEPNHAALALGERARLICAARITGALFDLGDYPGLVPGSGGIVHGELLAIHDPALIDQLDAFEDYYPDDPAGSEYLRVKVETLDAGQSAWTYAYNRSVEGLAIIASGDWRVR